MIKNKKLSKKSKSSWSKQRVAVVLLGIWVALLTIALIASTTILYHMWKVQQSEAGWTIKSLVLIAVDDLSKPVPVEARTGQLYIPQSKLVFPTEPDTLGVGMKYRYTPAWEDIPEELRIVNPIGYMSARSQFIGGTNIEEVFGDIPELQACSRGYHLTFVPYSDSSVYPIFVKTLSDGRVLYVYLDSGCSNRSDEFEAYLKQVDSY